MIVCKTVWDNFLSCSEACQITIFLLLEFTLTEEKLYYSQTLNLTKNITRKNYEREMAFTLFLLLRCQTAIFRAWTLQYTGGSVYYCGLKCSSWSNMARVRLPVYGQDHYSHIDCFDSASIDMVFYSIFNMSHKFYILSASVCVLKTVWSPLGPWKHFFYCK